VSRIALVHLDESCLGNGREGENPGGYGGLIEARTRSGIQRRDLYGHATGTTNNRMALIGASTALQVLGGKGSRMQVLIVSDSEYLVKGMRLWAPSWEARGWKRTAGPIENLQLWQDLVAREKKSSPGAVESGFAEWLAAKQAKKKFAGYDPDSDFEVLQRRLAAGEEFPLAG
jgi:ribonuclease HI